MRPSSPRSSRSTSPRLGPKKPRPSAPTNSPPPRPPPKKKASSKLPPLPPSPRGSRPARPSAPPPLQDLPPPPALSPRRRPTLNSSSGSIVKLPTLSSSSGSIGKLAAGSHRSGPPSPPPFRSSRSSSSSRASESAAESGIFVWGETGADLVVHPRGPSLSASMAEVVEVALGEMHVLLRTSQGRVWSYGLSTLGRLGASSSQQVASSPLLVRGLENVVQVAAGGAQSAVICADSQVYYWGTPHAQRNLVVSTPTLKRELSSVQPERVRVGRSHMLVGCIDGTVYAWGESRACGVAVDLAYTQAPSLLSLPKCYQIFASGDSSAAITLQGSHVYVWGAIANVLFPGKPLGVHKLSFRHGAKDVGLGHEHVAIVSLSGHVFTAGRGTEMQLGISPPPETLLEPTHVELVATPSSPPSSPPPSDSRTSRTRPATSGAFKRRLLKKGSHSVALAGPVDPATNVVCGNETTTVLTASGKVYSWGRVIGDTKKLCERPTLIRDLEFIKIESIWSGSASLAALVGLRNSKDLKFFSFAPIPIIKSASLRGIIDWASRSSDSTFLYALLLTYPCFTSATELLELLRSKYEASSEPEVQKNLSKLLIRWLKEHRADFEDRALRILADDFLTVIQSASHTAVIHRLLSQKPAEQTRIAGLSPPPTGTRSAFPENYSPTVVAEQLCLVDWVYFCRLDPRSLLSANSAENEHMAALTRRFNALSRYVIGSIMLTKSVDERSERWEFWVSVHRQVFELNNLFAATAINAAFQSHAIYSLVEKGHIDTKRSSAEWIKGFTDLTIDKVRWRKKLQRVAVSGEPGVPFLGNMKTELLYVLDGNPSFVDQGQVHFYKFHLLAKQLRAVSQLQARSYSAVRVISELYYHFSDPPEFSEAKERELLERLVRDGPSAQMGAATLRLTKRRGSASALRGLRVTKDEGGVGASDEKGSRAPRFQKWTNNFAQPDFAQAWSESGAWERTVVDLLLEKPMNEEERAAFRKLCNVALAPADVAQAWFNFFVTLSESEPSKRLATAVGNYSSSFKRVFSQRKPDPQLPQDHIKVMLDLPSAVEKMEACTGETAGTTLSVIDQHLKALEDAKVIRERLELPISKSQRQMQLLMEDRERVREGILQEASSAQPSLDARMQRLRELQELELSLLEQLKRCQKERADLQADIDQSQQEHGSRKVNVDKKMAILQQQLNVEQRSLHANKSSLEDFAHIQEHFEEAHKATLERAREAVVARLVKKTHDLLLMCRAFNQTLEVQGPHPILGEQWSRFSKNVLYKAVADITEGGTSAQELKEIREHIGRLNAQFQ